MALLSPARQASQALQGRTALQMNREGYGCSDIVPLESMSLS